MKKSATCPWIKPLSEKLAHKKKMQGFALQPVKKTSTKKDGKND
jgi:hypothetical protein